MTDSSDFVSWFRSAAPYIRSFSGKTFVIAFDGEIIEEGNFIDLTHDINLLVSVGVKVVLIHGSRPQIERAIKEKKIEPIVTKEHVRITDQATLNCVKETNGRLRVEIEALMSMGLPNTPLAGSPIRITSGNFVIARPKGVVDGIDMLYSGDVRQVRADAIGRRLSDGELVLISPMGYSPTGETFNLQHQDVAAKVATSLNADKLIFLTKQTGLMNEEGELLKEIVTSEVKKLALNKKSMSFEEYRLKQSIIEASENGVDRIHVINRELDGGILLELFTHEGIGTMISRDPLENLREANDEDIGGILTLIEPLEKDGLLVRRTRELLENEIHKFVIVEHDRLIVGCAALNTFPEDGTGEIACLAVHSQFQNAGVGEQLLKSIEAKSRTQKLTNLFVLTTATSHWFLQNGFEKGSLDSLPKRKAKLYNHNRKSNIFTKRL